MKFETQRESFARALALPAAIAPTKTTKESFQVVRIRTASNAVALQATDGDAWAKSVVTVDSVLAPGEVALTSSLLETILNTVEGKTVVLESQGRFCEIRSEDAHYTLVAHDSLEDLSDPPEVQPFLKIDRDPLESMLQRCMIAVGKDVGRYAVNGILLEFEGSTLTMVATDSRRLVRTSSRVVALGAEGPMRRAVVPPKIIVEALRSTTSNDVLELGFNEEFCTLRTSNVLLSSRLVLGDFPDHRRIVPTNLPHNFRVPTDSILAAVRKSAVFAQEPVRAVRFDLTEGLLTLKSESEGRGRSSTRIVAESEKSTAIEIDLNPDYLLDYLKTVSSQAVRFEFRDSQSAILVREEVGDSVYLVMPITAN